MEPIFLGALNSPLKARRWLSDTCLRIGSKADREISWSDPGISPEHALVVATADGWFVYDQGSDQGTHCNGVRVGPQGQSLRPNDVIQCGSLQLQVLEPKPQLIKTSTNLVKVQAVVQRSWEKALERLAAQPDPAQEQAKHLLTLFRTGYHLCRVECPDELMQAILDDALTVLQAQRASIVLVDEFSGKLQVNKMARADQAPRFRKWFSRTLARRCFDRGQSILCQDVGSEMGHDSEHSTMRQNMSSIICALLRTPRKKLGVLHLDRGPQQPAFSLSDFSLADAIAASVSAGIETAQLLVQQSSLFLHTVTALARAVEIRDRYTGNHTQRVTDYALMLADELQVAPADRHVILIGTPLHDIGKIGITDRILQKPGKLTVAEFDEMKTHAEVGASLLATIPGLRPTLPIIRHHHERWDGAGYPDRLDREQIPLLARIVAVADAFDAMTSDRPYRRALSLPQAFKEIADGKGTHFDPRCASAFVHLRPHVEARANAN